MSSISRQIAVVAACILAACGAPALAATTSPPDNVAEALADAARVCKEMNAGTPNTDAVLTTEDLNGDGGEDWIADYAKMKCEGGVNPLCNDTGCTLQIYFWDGAASWDIVFEDIVRSYKFGTSAGKRMLYVTTSGVPCNKPVAETCTYNYRLDADTIVPVK